MLKSQSTNGSFNTNSGCEQRGIDVPSYTSERKSLTHGQPIAKANGVHEHYAYSIDRYVDDIDPREKVRLGMLKGTANGGSTECSRFKSGTNQK